MTEPQEHETDAVIEDVEQEAVDLAVETLSGDLADALLDRIKNLRKPWQQCNQAEQRDLVTGMRGATEHLVTEAVRKIAAFGRRVIVVHVEKVDIKGGLKATITCQKTQQALLDLGMAEGNTALIVLADEEQFIGARTSETEATDPDQGDLLNHIESEGGTVQESPEDNAEENDSEEDNDDDATTKPQTKKRRKAA
jgi:hypothetical protein